MRKSNLYILVCLFLVSCSKLKEDTGNMVYQNPIRIAYLGPFSEVRLGAEGKFLGAFLAAEEINRHGGINGRDIELIRRNDGGSAEKGVEVAQKLHQEGIDIILGGDWSSVTLAVAKQVAIPDTMLMVSYSSTNPDISFLEDHNLIWRTVPSDRYQGKIGANYCYRIKGKKTAGLICFDNPWAIGLAEAFGNEFEHLGGQVTSFNIYPELFGNDIAKYDYSPHLDSLFEPKPEVVYFAAFPADGAKISADIARKKYFSDGYHPLIFSNDGLYSNYFLLNGYSGIINGMMGTVPGSPELDPNFMLFSDNYRKRWGFKPVPFSEHAYDALYLIAYAMLEANGSTHPSEIAGHLLQVSGGDNNPAAIKINVDQFAYANSIINDGGVIDYDGASGLISFDGNGDPGSGTYLIWEILKNQYITDTIISFP